MSVLLIIFQVVVAVAGCLAAVAGIPVFFAFRWPAFIMWGVKLYVSALSPVLFLLGLFTVFAAVATGSLFIGLIGAYNIFIYLLHFTSITRGPGPSTGFARAFGFDWERRIPATKTTYFLPRRTSLWLPTVPAPRLQQDLCFATLGGNGRQLLCDVWQPPATVPSSGLAFIYLHGSAFYFLDKDFGTRPFFRHLAAQGHVIMDVAYRLAPETDIMGMIHDAKRAVAWMKANARRYGIAADGIVMGGGSAGAHLALMTAYTAGDARFTPEGLEGADTGVRGVISLYGPTDLAALYYHTNQHLTTHDVPGKPKKAVPKKPGWMVQVNGKDFHRLGFDKDFAQVGSLARILGGHPDECPERYAQFSVLNHVHSGCPPTLLVHGEHDIMAPVTTTRMLGSRLLQQGVTTVMHILPQTDHGFDLVLPGLSPAAHNALFDVERFMALLAVVPPKERLVTGQSMAAGRAEG